jgi:putative hydrolase of the HAD superfamily
VNNSIDTVLFDLDGTLVFHEPDSLEVLGAFCTEIGQPLNAKVRWQVLRTRHEYFVDPKVREELGRFSPDQFWQHFNRRLLAAAGIQGDLDHLAREITRRIGELDFGYYCPEHGLQTLIELRQRGYGLGLITNRENVERFHELLDLTQLRPYFDLLLASGEVGVSKPNPGIFHAALDRMGTTAGRSLYIGDNYWADVVGAQRAGLTPVLLDPYRVFPEADCLILDRTDDLLAWLP